MKIAVSASGKDMSSEIDPRFGRAALFLFVDSVTRDVRVVENRQNLDLPQGAGIQAAQTIAAEKADVLLTGNCGPKAFKVLTAAKVKVVVGARGRVDQALERYLNGELKHSDEANVEGHWV
jgi:predicted Fe-Mo cluster-binding NifX family protein